MRIMYPLQVIIEIRFFRLRRIYVITNVII
uniref:Uncharacterized protein n=1 Tax=Dulem virus 42 TaxID=3145760 RepID=A0AAU8B8U4_9CAUD